MSEFYCCMIIGCLFGLVSAVYSGKSDWGCIMWGIGSILWFIGAILNK